MMPWIRTTALANGGRMLALVMAAALSGGCLDAPKIEDRWTRIDVNGANVTPGQALAPGSTQAIQLRAAITYRALLTGFAVAELRASSMPTAAVTVRPDAPRQPMAEDIDRILASSVSLGRATRAVTGWDHLIQTIDFSFTGATPAVADSSSAGLFLLCYLGSGQRIELASGAESTVVTPFRSQDYQILPVGMGFTLAAGTP